MAGEIYNLKFDAIKIIERKKRNRFAVEFKKYDCKQEIKGKNLEKKNFAPGLDGNSYSMLPDAKIKLINIYKKLLLKQAQYSQSVENINVFLKLAKDAQDK